ncbi:MAG: hypothetical protein ACI8ZO_001182 [Flavobacteriales bacterium]
MLFSIGFSSCKKDKTQVMPTITFTGANTFGCYISGELFVPVRDLDFSGGCGGAHGEYYLVYRDSIFESVDFNGGQCEEDRAIQFRL